MTVNIDWDDQTRTDLINAIASKINAKTYLEIGCASNDNFNKVDVSHKVGVDPEQGGTIRCDSDTFFLANKETFDLIFIDGLHEHHQVIADVLHAMAVLNPNGAIVLHDCLPTRESVQTVPPSEGVWLGDVWKAIFYFNDSHGFDVAVTKIDWGCGMIRKRDSATTAIATTPTKWLTATYKDFEENYDKLKLLSFEEAIDWI